MKKLFLVFLLFQSFQVNAQPINDSIDGFGYQLNDLSTEINSKLVYEKSFKWIREHHTFVTSKVLLDNPASFKIIAETTIMVEVYGGDGKPVTYQLVLDFSDNKYRSKITNMIQSGAFKNESGVGNGVLTRQTPSGPMSASKWRKFRKEAEILAERRLKELHDYTLK